jgi:LPPG:FO 2-phospho-L-lactate transferase
VAAISPLVRGKALKGPADRVLVSLGLKPGNAGVAKAYDGVADILVIDNLDRADVAVIDGVEVVVEDTLIKDPTAATRLGRVILGL